MGLRLLTNTKTGAASGLPWSNLKKDAFFPYFTIEPDRWDQLFPYRIMVIDSANGNSIVGGTVGAKISVIGSRSDATLSFKTLDNQWVFTLPITPQQLSITDQYAINTSASLKGVLEEHSGLRFKLISAAGTMGVWPSRESITDPPASPTVLESIFGGTIQNAQNVINQATRAISTAKSGSPNGKPTSKRPESSGLATSTAYYNANALQQFLEQYAIAKTKPENKSWRLVFDIPKKNESFVVTPLPFVWQQNANAPMKIDYSLQFKAWRRIDLKQSVSTKKPEIESISPVTLQRVLNTITEARKVASASLNLIGAVRSDIDAPLEVLRQTALFVKDLAGVAVNAGDLPAQIIRDYASSIKSSLRSLQDAISTTSSDPTLRNSMKELFGGTDTSEGLSLDAIKAGQLGQQAQNIQILNPANNVFANPAENFSLMDQVPVSSLSLTDVQQDEIDQIIEDSRNLTVDDIRQARDIILELTLQLSNNFGSGDQYFSDIYRRAAPKDRIQSMTLAEYDILNTFYNVIQSYDLLTASTSIDDDNKQTSMEYVAGLADDSGIPFSLTQAKILVPVPFGLTMEAISQRYLKDSQRWIEIATLNNLRDPYIDENGFQRSLLSNGSDRQITVDSIENMYIGQRVVLRSSTQPQSPRRILGIDRLSDTSFLITLDGLPNLDNFILADSAYLQAYLPGTINSQQKIFIPSDLPIPNDSNIAIPASAQSDPLSGLSKVDLLLTDTGDLAVNSYGDFRLSYGMTNIIQTLKIKLGTRKGTVLPHPEFGLGLSPGILSSEVNVQEIYNSINELILEDPRFQGVESLQISLDGPTLNISMGVLLAGTQGVFPVTFQLAA